MSEHVDDLLLEYAMGTLPADQLAALDAHVEGCARCRAEAALAGETLAAMATSLPAVEPSGATRARILDALRPARPVPGIDHAGAMAEFFDVLVPVARGLLERAAIAASWTPGPMPGVALMRVLPGPRVAHADTALLRVDGGVILPPHTHLGEERTLMLDGAQIIDETRRISPGELDVMPPGSRHAVRIPTEGCLCALVIDGAMDFEGVGLLRLLDRQ